MATRELLTLSQRKLLYEIPAIMDERTIARYYTISDEELEIVHQQRGAANRLGFTIQIGYLRFPEHPLTANEVVPDFIVHYVADQLKISPSVMQQYAKRDPTRREYLVKIRNAFGFGPSR